MIVANQIEFFLEFPVFLEVEVWKFGELSESEREIYPARGSAPVDESKFFESVCGFSVHKLVKKRKIERWKTKENASL